VEGGILDAVKKHWYLVLAIVGALSWFTSQVVGASATMADINDSIQRNQEKIVDLEEDVEKHEEGVGHPQVNERLIRVETELIHINRSQLESFQDIKLQLNTMQEDIKEINRNP
tara:strand:+ start:63 stop:404 length:342 start_codon:yes stop_codon:yes gene_type:complete